MPTNPRFNGKSHSQLPDLISDTMYLKDLPQTSDAPAGYGNVATVVNGLVDAVGGASRKIVYADEYGVVYDGLSATPTDNKVALEAAIAAAGQFGCVILQGMAATSPITLTRTNGIGFKLVGAGSVSDLIFTNSTAGLCPVGDQASILTIGEDAGTVEGLELNNIAIYGNNKNISNAALVIQRWSQGATHNLIISNVKGLGVRVVKWEDVNNYDMSVIKCGDPVGQQGGMRFFNSPDLQSNVISFLNCRFEWIDGPHVSLDTSNVNSAVSHLTFHNTKHEVAERDGYGTTRALNPVFDFRGSTFDKVQNIRVLDGWISQSEQCREVLRLGRSHSVQFDNVKMSNVDGLTVKLFTLSESGGTDARDFKFTRTSIINTSGNYTNFKIDCESNNINTMHFDRPIEYNTNGSRLSNAVTYWDANVIGIDGQLTSSPDYVSDPCVTPNKVVCVRTGSSNSAIAWLGSARYDKDGVLSGFSGNMDKGIYEIRIRCKKAGNAATARIEIRGSAFLGQVDIANTTYEWKSVWVNTRSATGTMAITLSTFNQADHTVYIDAVEVIPTKEFFASAIPASGSYVAGERVWFTAPTAGSPAGAVCVTSGTPGTWKNMASLAV